MSDQTESRPTPGKDSEANEHHTSPLGLWHVIRSVFAAGLGVQSSRNRERDFKQGRLGVFIAAGVIFTLLFITLVVVVVQIVVSNAA